MSATRTLYIFPGDPNSEEAKKACGRGNKSIRIVDITTVQRLPAEVDGVPVLQVANRFFKGKTAINACATFAKFNNRSGLNSTNFSESLESSSRPKEPQAIQSIEQAPVAESSSTSDKFKAFSSGSSNNLRTFETDRTMAPFKACSNLEELMNQRNSLYK